MSKTDIESMVATTHSKRHNFTNNRGEKDKLRNTKEKMELDWPCA